MKIFQEESQASNDGGSSLSLSQNNNISLEQAPFKLLNLRLTKSPEFIDEIETLLQQPYTSNPAQNLKNPEKPKSLNFPIKEIRIGDWNRVAVYPDDLKAKLYFAKKKLMWETLDFVETETATTLRLKRKIEMEWSDVLSFEASYHPHDQTGTLKVELNKRPKFYIETNPRPGKHTQWQQMDQDFTTDQSASTNRRHTLYFGPGVLQKNLDKLVSSHSFWTKLVKVRFPALETPYFDIGYGNSNSNDSMDTSRYSHGQTLSFNVNNNNVDQLLGNQVIQPFFGSQFNNSTFQDMSQMRNPGELQGNGFQEYAYPSIQGYGYTEKLLGTQTNSMMFKHMNQPSTYPQFGPCLQEGVRQNMEHTQLDGDFHINGNQHMDFNQFAEFDHDQYISSMFPDIDIEYDLNCHSSMFPDIDMEYYSSVYH